MPSKVSLNPGQASKRVIILANPILLLQSAPKPLSAIGLSRGAVSGGILLAILGSEVCKIVALLDSIWAMILRASGVGVLLSCLLSLVF